MLGGLAGLYLRKPPGQATISKVLFFFKQQSPKEYVFQISRSGNDILSQSGDGVQGIRIIVFPPSIFPMRTILCYNKKNSLF